MIATAKKLDLPPVTLTRPEPGRPVFTAPDRATLIVRAGARLDVGDDVRAFAEDLAVALPDELAPGADYQVVLAAGDIAAVPWGDPRAGGMPVLGGFHFAPGGNATARAGGDETPAINPASIWDAGFRPACPDPRGMALVHGPDGLFWPDIYLTGRDHLELGTSRFGVVIADGGSALPHNPGGGHFDRLDHAAALAIAAHHGKRLMSFEEHARATFGVTERTSDDGKADLAGLSAPRTSRAGLMQATGQRWVRGHDGDPDDPRASIFGGSWIHGWHAGSRYADLGDWVGDSFDDFSLRLASDHLSTD